MRCIQLWLMRNRRSLPVRKCLDVESQRRTDTHDVFTIEFLEDGCLACVVKSTAPNEST
jgi:hypothetical protein